MLSLITCISNLTGLCMYTMRHFIAYLVVDPIFNRNIYVLKCIVSFINDT